jgi:hypothetical protein
MAHNEAERHSMDDIVSENRVATPTLSRLNHAIGPVMAGMLIDSLDLITFGPVGLIAGLPLGAAAGYWLGQSMGLDRQGRRICSLAAGIYCTIPFTEIIPLGTIVGALCRFQEPIETDERLPMMTAEPLREQDDVSSHAAE